MGSRNGHRVARSVTTQAVVEPQHIVRHLRRLRGGQIRVALEAKVRAGPQMRRGGWPPSATAMTGEAVAQAAGVVGQARRLSDRKRLVASQARSRRRPEVCCGGRSGLAGAMAAETIAQAIGVVGHPGRLARGGGTVARQAGTGSETLMAGGDGPELLRTMAREAVVQSLYEVGHTRGRAGEPLMARQALLSGHPRVGRGGHRVALPASVTGEAIRASLQGVGHTRRARDGRCLMTLLAGIGCDPGMSRRYGFPLALSVTGQAVIQPQGVVGNAGPRAHGQLLVTERTSLLNPSAVIGRCRHSSTLGVTGETRASFLQGMGDGRHVGRPCRLVAEQARIGCEALV